MVTSGAGALWLLANPTITVSGGSSISGNLHLYSTGTCTIQGDGALHLYANVSGTVDIVKNDTAMLILDGSNTFTGTLTANTGGYIYARNNLALGATNGGTIINDSAFLALNPVSITNEALTMNTGNSYGLYSVSSSANIWSGPISLSQGTMVDVVSGGSLEIIGSITGTGSLTKTGAGTLIFSGATGNYYDGVTTVNEGQLDLNKAPNVGAFSWTGLVIGDGTGTDTVRCLQPHQIWS